MCRFLHDTRRTVSVLVLNQNLRRYAAMLPPVALGLVFS